MNSVLSEWIEGVRLIGSVEADYKSLFLHHGHIQNTEHSHKVAQEARRLARLFGEDEEAALTAGYVHDISEIIPDSRMVDTARQLGLDVLDEECQFPIILHQRLSKVFAAEIFNITDGSTLRAIECHTTLNSSPTPLDMIVFISDKIVWDKKYNDPFIRDVLKGLETSLEHGCYGYVRYLMENQQSLKVLHPWTLAAHAYLSHKCI